MNRLSSLIVRRVGPFAPPLAWEGFADQGEAGPDPLADLKLFATGWMGGFVFFGTLLA